MAAALFNVPGQGIDEVAADTQSSKKDRMEPG